MQDYSKYQSDNGQHQLREGTGNEQELNYDNICKKDENFEEITESKEIIEDRINKIKMVIVDFTIKQQDLTDKIQKQEKDI